MKHKLFLVLLAVSLAVAAFAFTAMQADPTACLPIPGCCE